jgi:hypothetical protein
MAAKRVYDVRYPGVGKGVRSNFTSELLYSSSSNFIDIELLTVLLIATLNINSQSHHLIQLVRNPTASLICHRRDIKKKTPGFLKNDRGQTHLQAGITFRHVTTATVTLTLRNIKVIRQDSSTGLYYVLQIELLLLVRHRSIKIFSDNGRDA